MAYTVKKLAAMSGVSIRTLRWYDEVGLLKPAYYGANGYRYYEEAQLLKLQQVLFYRELGLELREIRRVLGRSEFDRIAALESHRKALALKMERAQRLIETVDRTIEHLKGKRKMKSEEMFGGFTVEQQTKHEDDLVGRFGEGMRKSIDESKRRVRKWTKADWERSNQGFASICKDFVELMRHGHSSESPEVQRVIRRHYEWMQQFWMPTRESYAGHSRLIEDSQLRQAYLAYDERLPGEFAEAIRCFAERELAQ